MYYGICNEHWSVCYKQAICPSRDSGTKNAERSEGSSSATTLTHAPHPYVRHGLVHLRVGVLVAEVACVRVAAQTRAPRRRHLLLLHRLPIHTREERVRFDLLLSPVPNSHLLRVGGSGAEASGRVSLEKEGNEVARLEREIRLVVIIQARAYSESQLGTHYLAKHDLTVRVVEGRLHVN